MSPQVPFIILSRRAAIAFLIAVVTLLSTPTSFVSAESAEKESSDAADKSIYICLDDENPCISDEPDGCPDCGDEVEKKPYNLHYHMEVVAAAAKAAMQDIRTKEYDKILSRTRALKLVASRVTEFPPPANTSDTAQYEVYAKRFYDLSTSLETAAGMGDKKAIQNAYKDLAKTCTGCHQLYRE